MLSWRLLVTKKDRGGACAAILCLHLICTSDVLGVRINPLVMMTVEKWPCAICDGFSDVQREILFTPYILRKEKKTGVLVSPENVTVIASIEDKEPTFHSSPPTSQPSAHAQSEVSGSSASFVTSDQLKHISDQWTEQFARFEALLSRGNVFSTPKSTVKPVPTHTVVSDTPFTPPPARLTSPVDVPAEGEVGLAQDKTVLKIQKTLKKRRSQGNPVKRVGIKIENQKRDKFHLHWRSGTLTGQRLSLLRFMLSHRFKLKPPPVGRVCDQFRLNLY